MRIQTNLANWTNFGANLINQNLTKVFVLISTLIAKIAKKKFALDIGKNDQPKLP